MKDFLDTCQQFKKDYLDINNKGEYKVSIFLFVKVLAVIYFIAFLSFAIQAGGLIGSDGILPAAQYLQAVQNQQGLWGILVTPTLFWFSTSDFFLKLVPILGAIFSLLLFFEIKERLMLVLLFVFYLSVTIAGREFMAYQWDSLLLEVGFLSIFITPNSSLIIWLFRWLLFRLMFSSGMVKILSGDELWRNLTALNYHYLTQPLPTVFAWYVDKLPTWFDKISTAIMFMIELIIPFFYFLSRKFRWTAGAFTVLLMTLITITGNYTLFTALTAVLVIFLFSDKDLNKVIKTKWVQKIKEKEFLNSKTIQTKVLPAVGATLILLSILTLSSQFGANLPKIVSTPVQLVKKYRIVNSYGLFASMTHPRYEIIIQGSNDGKNWKTYRFKYKPTDLSEPPVWVQPHQPRLDWQMWFAALSNFQNQRWFQRFIVSLLQNKEAVTDLLEKNPFPIHPPRYIRALRYKYEFSSFKQREKTGNWWKRSDKRLYMPPVSLTR